MKTAQSGILSLALAAFLFAIVPTVIAQKSVTVRFANTEANLPAASVEKFNKENQDGITLVRTELDYTKFIAEAMAGNASDLMSLGNGSDVAFYSARSLLLPITKYLQASKVIRISDIDMLGNANYLFDVKTMQFGKGEWYGMAQDYNNIGGIVYNKEMFKAAGLPNLSETVPISYEDLYQLARKLTVKDASGKTLVWGTDPFYFFSYASNMATAQGLSFYADADADKTAMNPDPRMRDIWKYWARFAVENLAPNAKDPAPSWAGPNFLSDRVAIIEVGYWFGVQLRSSPGFNEKYGWAPTPVVSKGGKRVGNTLGGTGVVFYAKTKVPDAAFKVFEWYIGGDVAKARAASGWGISPLKSLQALLPEADNFDRSRKMIALDDAKYFLPWQSCPWTSGGPTFRAAWNGPIEKYVKGEVNADQFVDLFYANMNKSIANGRAELGF